MHETCTYVLTPSPRIHGRHTREAGGPKERCLDKEASFVDHDSSAQRVETCSLTCRLGTFSPRTREGLGLGWHTPQTPCDEDVSQHVSCPSPSSSFATLRLTRHGPMDRANAVCANGRVDARRRALLGPDRWGWNGTGPVRGSVHVSASAGRHSRMIHLHSREISSGSSA